MKSGKSSGAESFDSDGNPELVFRYWVLPDKPMMSDQTEWASGVRTWRWDKAATQRQTEQICVYLKETCEGAWQESRYRFYFELEQDWEMFKTMCMIGWQ
jgi:hypothetical protein